MNTLYISRFQILIKLRLTQMNDFCLSPTSSTDMAWVETGQEIATAILEAVEAKAVAVSKQVDKSRLVLDACPTDWRR